MWEQNQVAALDRTGLTTAEYLIRINNLESQAAVKRAQAAQQFPTVWDNAMKQVEQSFTYAYGQIINQFSGAIAGMITGTQKFSQAVKQMEQAVVQTVVNMFMKIAAEYVIDQIKHALKNKEEETDDLLSRTRRLAAYGDEAVATEAIEAEKQIAISAAAEVGSADRILMTQAETKVSGAAALSTVMAMSGAAEGATAIMGATVEEVVAVVAAIGAALSTNPFTAVAGASLVATAAEVELVGGAAVISGGEAILAADEAATAAMAPMVALAGGGIVMGPTHALVGEAGPEAVIPLDKYHGGSGGKQTIIIELAGKPILNFVRENLPGELRLRGVAAY